MRWVIVVVSIAIFIIWDGLKNDGHYIELAVYEVSQLRAKLRYRTGRQYLSSDLDFLGSGRPSIRPLPAVLFSTLIDHFQKTLSKNMCSLLVSN
jgi:hypothetical protein